MKSNLKISLFSETKDGQKKKNKRLKKERVRVFETSGFEALGKVKSKCCKKYKKADCKHCKKCPCIDLLKKVA